MCWRRWHRSDEVRAFFVPMLLAVQMRSRRRVCIKPQRLTVLFYIHAYVPSDSIPKPCCIPPTLAFLYLTMIFCFCVVVHIHDIAYTVIDWYTIME